MEDSPKSSLNFLKVPLAYINVSKVEIALSTTVKKLDYDSFQICFASLTKTKNYAKQFSLVF